MRNLHDLPHVRVLRQAGRETVEITEPVKRIAVRILALLGQLASMYPTTQSAAVHAHPARLDDVQQFATGSHRLRLEETFHPFRPDEGYRHTETAFRAFRRLRVRVAGELAQALVGGAWPVQYGFPVIVREKTTQLACQTVNQFRVHGGAGMLHEFRMIGDTVNHVRQWRGLGQIDFQTAHPLVQRALQPRITVVIVRVQQIMQGFAQRCGSGAGLTAATVLVPVGAVDAILAQVGQTAVQPSQVAGQLAGVLVAQEIQIRFDAMSDKR